MLSATSQFNSSATPFAPDPIPETATRLRLEFVDGLRALAALFVVLSHAWLTIPTRREGHGSGWLNHGHLAVDLFIVLSGFCLALPMSQPRSFGLLRGGTLEYYKRRARRILPPYYFAVALSLALIATLIGHATGTHWDVALPATWQAVLAHVLLIEDVVDPSRINHALWSIAVEWQIYFLLPLIALGWRRVGPVFTTLITTVAAYGAIAATKTIHPLGPSAWLFIYVALFGFGTLAAFVATTRNTRWEATRKPLPWTIIVLLLAAGVRQCVVHEFGSTYWMLIRIDLTAGLFSAALLVLASCSGKNILREALSAKPLVFLGTFAYSIYLIHAPLLQVVWQYAILPLHLTWQKQFLALVFIGIPIIVTACYLFFLGCERPWLARRPRENMRELARDAAVSPAP